MKGSSHSTVTQPNQDGQPLEWAEIKQQNNKKCIIIIKPSIIESINDILSYVANIINEQTMFTIAEYDRKCFEGHCIFYNNKGDSRSIQYDDIFGNRQSFLYVKFILPITDNYTKTLYSVQKAAKLINHLNQITIIDELYDETIKWIKYNLI